MMKIQDNFRNIYENYKERIVDTRLESSGILYSDDKRKGCNKISQSIKPKWYENLFMLNFHGAINDKISFMNKLHL